MSTIFNNSAIKRNQGVLKAMVEVTGFEPVNTWFQQDALPLSYTPSMPLQVILYKKSLATASPLL
jgi:hypothetical protein